MNGSLTSNLLRPSIETLVKQCSCLLHILSYTTCWTQHHLLQLPLDSLECGALLQSFTNTKSIKQGQKLHAHMISFCILENNTYLNTKLAAFYAGCGQMAQAEVIFNGIVLKNSFLWNFMIRGYASNGLSMKSIILYREMLCFGQRADNFTYPFVLKACGDLLLVEIGRRVHSQAMICGLQSDIYVGNSLLAMYAKFGDMGTARMVFDRMTERDLTSWNTMISGYTKNADSEMAFLVFELMGKSGLLADCPTLLGLLSACTDLKAVRQGKEIHCYAVRHSIGSCNNFLANSLIEMYCICNCMVDAQRLFEKVRRKDTISWNSMILGYVRSGNAFESLRLFGQMALDGSGPDQVTFVAVLGACDQIAALRYGMSIHSYLVKKGFDASTFVGTALVDMYSKCGSLACSRRVFDEMTKKSLVSWSAMIAGYGLHGKGREAISILNGLQANSVIPDGGVFTSILSACSHSGLVSEGKEIFYKMKREYNLKPTLSHHSCMVDLLGRAGHLDEAYEIIRTMEVKPTSDIWAALLTASRLHKNVQLAEVSAQKVFEMNPEGVSSYICLSNIYAAEKRWEDVERIRDIARRKGLKKPPGYSFIELDNRIHRFLVGDKSHPQTDHIYAKLEELKQQLKEAGYKPDTSSVLYAVEEEVKEKMLWDHSERLAIAFALINTGPDMVIRITKNLRVCGDCHTVTKLISKLTGREIIMRDIHRFHHFTKGFCSCGDYW